jgi:Bacteriophage T4-like portal protein (Gp20)
VAWTKHFTVIKSAPVMPQVDRSQAYSTMTARTSSWLNIAYQGNPQRIPRYYQFQEMDSDSDINTALDTIADFCTQSEEQSDEPFEVKFNGEPNESEVKIIKQMLARWIKLNSLRSRLWYMFRDCIKNGDAFFLRDPETQEWLWLDHFMVELVKVDETKGKVPDEYIIRGLDYNRQTKFGSKQADPNAYRTPFGTSTVGGARPMGGASSSPASFSMVGTDGDQRQRGMQGPFSQELSVVDAQFVVHLSLSIGNDINWPFGPSILEPIFKTFKQKELLEDAIIIYRVQRAPERRIFYIDVGTMPPERAKRHIEAIKNDIHQRRIPNRTGTGGCFDMATRVPLLDGRTLSLTELSLEYQAGKQNWAYSCHPENGAVAPGKITWAGVTQQNAQVIKLTLDNGETIICTLEHKYPIMGKGLIEAKDIKIGSDSLISFNTRLHPIDESKPSSASYQQVYDHAEKKWKFTHRVVGQFFKNLGLHNELGVAERKTVIHHHDCNKFNNTPENLFYMHSQDHFDLHAGRTANFLAAMSPEQYQAYQMKQSISGKARWNKMKTEQPEAYLAAKDRLQRNVAEHQKTSWPNQSNLWSQELYNILIETVNRYKSSKKATAKSLSSNADFMALYVKLNTPVGGKIAHLDLKRFSVTTLEKLIKHYGHTGWRELLERCALQVRKPSLGIKTNYELISAIATIASAMTQPKLVDLCAALSSDEMFMRMYTNLNLQTKGMSNKEKISINTLKTIITKHGYPDWTSFRNNLSCFNHKVVAIEYLPEPIEVGTLTIDGDEDFHNHHTFALESGVFVTNSIMDAAYNPLCISLSTIIPLVDGRALSLADLIMEHHDGKQNWVYSCNPVTGEITTGPITWAGVTRTATNVVCVTLDNGGAVIVTPDHKFPVLGGKLIPACDLTPAHELITRERYERNGVRTGHGSDWMIVHPLSVVELQDKIDVGTITVDKDETYHPFHNFAISENIFLQNSINDDYFFASSSEGRGSKVETLPGGDGNNEILDLTFFSKKLARGLRVPTSYLNIGDDSSNSVTFNDGKLGAAMIQEYRFSKYCMRLQSLLAPKFDHEFKRYLQKNGIEIEASLFELQFNPPQSFTRYRQIELDTQRVAVYQGVAENKKLAERFKLKRFLGLSEDEIIENEEMWAEENADKLKKKTGASPAEGGAGEGLSAVGIHPEGDMGMGAEMPEGDMPDGTDPEGGAGGAPVAPGGAAAAGSAPPAVAPA